MQNYHDLLEHLLNHGQFKPNRTGTGTFASVGHMLKFDLRDGFPAITTKQLAFKSMVGELLGFFRGYQSAAQFRDLKCKVWDKNANETEAWVNNPYRAGADDLGRIYGAQYTAWKSYREARNDQELKLAQAAGYKIVGHLNPGEDGRPQGWILHKTINQLEEALKQLITDPFNRRIVVSAWRPDEFDQMAIAPCPVAYQFICMPDGTLHSTLWQRSYDSFLAFNIATLGLLTEIMARLCGRTAASATFFVSDAHLYEDHTDQVRTQLTREHFSAPKLILSDRLQRIERVEDIKGVFERIEPEDIWLEGYQSHGKLSGNMAA